MLVQVGSMTTTTAVEIGASRRADPGDALLGDEQGKGDRGHGIGPPEAGREVKYETSREEHKRKLDAGQATGQ